MHGGSVVTREADIVTAHGIFSFLKEISKKYESLNFFEFFLNFLRSFEKDFILSLFHFFF